MTGFSPANVPGPPARLATAPRFAAFAALVLLTACGGTDATPGIEVTLGSASASLIRGATAEVPVTVTRLGGASGPVDLSIGGLPQGVSASFSPATLDGGTLTSTLSVSAAAAASEGAVTLTVVATGDSANDEATLALDVQSLTVVGRVQAPFTRPLVGATVTGQGQTAFTDATGSFTLGGLSIPYDVTVSSALGDGRFHVYEGMTSPTPTFRPMFAALGTASPNHAATVIASISSGALGVGEVARMCVEGVAVPVYGCQTVTTGESAFSVAATWFDGVLATVRLHAFHAALGGDGQPAEFLGYATTMVNLVDGDVTLAELDFGAVGAGTLSGTTAHPATLPDTALLVSARFGPNLSMSLFTPSAPGDDFQVLVPVLPGLTYDVLLVATGLGDPAFTWKRAVGLDAGDLVVPAPAQMASPVAGAIGVDLDTPFGATPTNGAITYLWNPDGAGPFMALTTTRSPATIPDPASFGLPYPAGLAYRWSILGHGNGGVDEAAAGGYADIVGIVFAVDGLGGPGFDANRTYSASSTTRSFTIAP